MWEAIASLAWTALAAFVLYKLWPVLADVLKREGTTIKVGSFELAVPQATQALGISVADIQERLSALELRVNASKPVTQEVGPGEATDEKAFAKSSWQRLLWVDDYPSNNAFLIEHFREKGIEVVISLSTRDALNRLKNEKFPAIITDLGREEDGVNNPYAGLDLIRAVRSQNDTTPILVFAGRRGMENQEKLLDAGANDVTHSGVVVTGFVDKHVRLGEEQS